MKVALVCIAKNEDNYIEEWVKYHKKIGFDSIFIYENDWDCNFDDPIITKIKFNGPSKQIEAYNDFIEKNIKYDDWNFDWVAFFDVDEFLVLKTHKTVKDFINDYKEYSSIGINWVLFGDNNIKNLNGDYSVIKRFIKRQKNINPHIKSIVKITLTTKMLIHNPTCKWVNTDKNLLNGAFNNNGNDNIAQINHYFCKTKEEFIEKINRGRSDNNNFRSIDDFEPHNINEIEDLTAYNFMYNDNNNILNTQK